MLGDDQDYDIIKSDDEEDETPSDPTERVIAQIFRILRRYKKENKNNFSSWINEVLTAETCFIGFIEDSKKNARFMGAPPLTVLDIQKYVLNKMAPTFTSSLAVLMGAHGGSKLRNQLEMVAKSWIVENKASEKKNMQNKIR